MREYNIYILQADLDDATTMHCRTHRNLIKNSNGEMTSWAVGETQVAYPIRKMNEGNMSV
jgi:ribosomal protein S6